MSEVLTDLYYSDTHEWIRVETGGGIVTIGVTDHAQDAMGDMVYVELPDVGNRVEEHGECGVLESVKSATDLYSPVAGEIVDSNGTLIDTPELVNKDPYGEGWLLKIRLEDPESVQELLDSDAYKELLQTEEE